MGQPIEPSEDLASLLPDKDGPWVMVNLLRFKPGGGSKAYGRYAAAFERLLVAAGGHFLYRGRVEASLIGQGDWHAVALVFYPSRQVFIDLIESDAYGAIHADREAGLEATCLFATQSQEIQSS